MGKFVEYYKTIMEEVDNEVQECCGVLIDPDRQTIEPFVYTETDLNEIRNKMYNSITKPLNSVPGALLFDDKEISKDNDFIFSIYNKPEDISVSGVGYIIGNDCNTVITVDEIQKIVRFGSAEELI